MVKVLIQQVYCPEECNSCCEHNKNWRQKHNPDVSIHAQTYLLRPPTTNEIIYSRVIYSSRACFNYDLQNENVFCAWHLVHKILSKVPRYTVRSIAQQVSPSRYPQFSSVYDAKQKGIRFIVITIPNRYLFLLIGILVELRIAGKVPNPVLPWVSVLTKTDNPHLTLYSEERNMYLTQGVLKLYNICRGYKKGDESSE